jgi:predicted glycosyltransferase
MRARLMLYCQHLAGIGHLIRSTELARALAAERWEVLLVCGGEVPDGYAFPDGVRVERLEALESDPEYKTLAACENGQDVDTVKIRRTLRLLSLYDGFAPDVLMTEMYPFGRKKFGFELEPLLERARNAEGRPVIVASVRDILVRREQQDAFEERVVTILNRSYDAVLVHSDELVQPLNRTFHAASRIRAAVVHTGYIVAGLCGVEADTMDAAARKFVADDLNGEQFVLVSCGSGRLRAGWQLTVAALEAAEALRGRFLHKLVVCAGPLAAVEDYEQYRRMALQQSNVVLVRDLPFLRNLMERAALSVSLGGYNTVMELMAARAQALVYAAEPNRDSEQLMRVDALAEAGQLRRLEARDLINGRLAGRIEEALSEPLPMELRQMDGARRSAQLLKMFLRIRQTQEVLTPCVSGRKDAGVGHAVVADEEGQTLCA